ncbi:ABC transporter permease [Patescibacteria group bacterium]|nr:ABC transporter permease [Patescibacteria group bacterium]
MIYDSTKRKHPAIEELLALFRYRDLIYQLVRRDIVARYKRSVLGIAWTMLNPLGTMLIMVVVFSQIFSAAENYAAYVLAGVICWTMFSQSTSMAMNSMVWGSQLFQQIYLPRTSFVVSTILSSMVNFILSLVPLGVILVISRVPLRPSALLLPLFMILLLAFSLGVALLLSTLAVFFPDIADLYPVFLTAWMYLTPILMPLEFYREILNGLLLYINPLYYIVNLFRILIIDGFVPHLQTWGATAFVSFGVLIVGWIFFCKKADSFAYHV